jgi:hypothetical protein
VISDLDSISLSSLLSSIPTFLLKSKSRPNSRFYSFLGFLYSVFSNCELSSLNSIIPAEVFQEQICEIKSYFGEFSFPAMQVVSGLICQDMIRCLTLKSECFSTLLFDSETSTAYSDKIN